MLAAPGTFFPTPIRHRSLFQYLSCPFPRGGSEVLQYAAISQRLNTEIDGLSVTIDGSTWSLEPRRDQQQRTANSAVGKGFTGLITPLRSSRSSRSAGPVFKISTDCCTDVNSLFGDILETVFVQSLGCETTLNFGAIGESPIRHNSISRSEETEPLLACNLVEPVQSSAVLICKTFSNPDDCYSLQPGARRSITVRDGCDLSAQADFQSAPNCLLTYPYTEYQL